MFYPSEVESDGQKSLGLVHEKRKEISFENIHIIVLRSVELE